MVGWAGQRHFSSEASYLHHLFVPLKIIVLPNTTLKWFLSAGFHIQSIISYKYKRHYYAWVLCGSSTPHCEFIFRCNWWCFLSMSITQGHLHFIDSTLIKRKGECSWMFSMVISLYSHHQTFIGTYMKRRRLWRGRSWLFALVSQLSNLFQCSQWLAINVIYGKNQYIGLTLGFSSIISSNCAEDTVSPTNWSF